MKDMTIEQKAKAYDEAIEKARKLYNSEETSADVEIACENIFPELKDSEDEKIRKYLIERIISIYGEKYSFTPEGIKVKDIIAWLEKQGEQKTIKCNDEWYDFVRWFVKERTDNYTLIPSDSDIHTWSNIILDHAKKELEKQGWQKSDKQPHSYELEEEIEEWLGCEAFPEGTNITPLPKAMDIVRETANHFYDFGRKQQAIKNIQCTNFQITTPKSYINEGQKKGIQIVLDNPQEYGLQKSAEWSEEDETHRHWILEMLKAGEIKTPEFADHFKAAFNWLKSLKPQSNITDGELVQAKKEAYNDALNKIEYHSDEPTFDDGWSAAIWYLKKRNAMPQKQWKPSDEQMNDLRQLTLLLLKIKNVKTLSILG